MRFPRAHVIVATSKEEVTIHRRSFRHRLGPSRTDHPPDAGNSFAPWVEALAGFNITGGCGGNDYCPTLPVNRQQMAVFLVKTFTLPF